MKLLHSTNHSQFLAKLLAFLWKSFKALLCLSFCFFISNLIYAFYRVHWVKEDYFYYKFESPKGIVGKIYIPEDIVKSRNCDALYKWQYEYVPREYHGKCPFAPIREKRKIGMAGLWFDFPRKYLQHMFSHPDTRDGPVDGELGGWTYPDMSTGTSWDNRISIYMRDNTIDQFGGREAMEYIYQRLLGLYDDSKYEIIFLNYDKEVKLNKYRVVEEIEDLKNKPAPMGKYMYTNDDPKKPEYYIVCDSDVSNICSSASQYKGLISIKYTFPRNLLPEHLGIRNQLLDFMRDYEIEKPY